MRVVNRSDTKRARVADLPLPKSADNDAMKALQRVFAQTASKTLGWRCCSSEDFTPVLSRLQHRYVDAVNRVSCGSQFPLGRVVVVADLLASKNSSTEAGLFARQRWLGRASGGG